MKRVLLKLSGEALAGEKHTGFDEATCVQVAKQVKEVCDSGVQVGVVIGGGNFWRGRTSVGMKTKVFTPFTMGPMAEMFTKDAAVECLEKGVVTFFAGGTGHPYFSTDTTTTLRAIEIEADVILLAKAVDGIYDSDPKLNPDAKKYDEISIQTVIDQKLGVMDLTASIMCMENKMPMMVFGLNEENSIVNTLKGKFSGTKVTV